MESSSKRLYFLDLFRGAFVLIMVEGHTFRALLDSSVQEAAVYRYHELLLHNLPGPAFLFASGAAFSLATLAYWESYRKWSPRLRARLLRWLSLLVLGYMLHLTYFSLRRTLSESTADQFAYLLSMDILQCIALSLLFLQLLVILLPSREWFFRATVAATLGISLATPWIWKTSAQLPYWMGTQVSAHWGSVFPLFPYAGFQFAGAVWGYLYVKARERNAEDQFLEQSLRFSIWLCFVSLAATLLPVSAIQDDFWRTGPTFFFLRVGLLGGLMVGFRRVESRILPYSSAIVLLGQQSLLVYAAHLVLLYGSAFNPDTHLRALLGHAQPLMHTAIVWLLLLGAMLAVCWLWTRWKKGHPWRARGIRWGLWGYLTYVFVSG